MRNWVVVSLVVISLAIVSLGGSGLLDRSIEEDRVVIAHNPGNSPLAAQNVFVSHAPASGTNDHAYDIVVDREGNSYMVSSYDTTIEIGGETFGPSISFSDSIVAKVAPGGHWLWGVAFEGGSGDVADIQSIALDDSGNVYVTGRMGDTMDAGSINVVGDSTGTEGFVARIAPTGVVEWVTASDGPGSTWLFDVEVTPGHGVLAVGWTSGTEDFGEGDISSPGGLDDGVLWNLNPENGSVNWVETTSGTGTERIVDAEVSDTGVITMTGYFYDDGEFGTFPLTVAGESDAFVARYTPGDAWNWAIQAGSSTFDSGSYVLAGPSDSVYVQGAFRDTSLFGTTALVSEGSSDMFIAQVTSNGSWAWVEAVSGISNVNGGGMQLDAQGNIVFGAWGSAYTHAGDFGYTPRGSTDVMVGKMSAAGEVLWMFGSGGTGYDAVSSIAVDDNGTIYATGWFEEDAVFGPTGVETTVTADAATDPYVWAFRVPDDDGDGVANEVDGCTPGMTGWLSHPTTDVDQDGCRDADEDLDDDGDTILDLDDDCPRGATHWISDETSDLDGDGCRDYDEDTDDDGDDEPDWSDDCPHGDDDCGQDGALGAVAGTNPLFFDVALLVIILVIGALLFLRTRK